jgi:uncharacterized coiled-coil protein SlyX
MLSAYQCAHIPPEAFFLPEATDMNDPKIEGRIQRLEEKLAFQEKTIADLDEVLTSMNLKFAEFGRGFEEMKRMVRQLEADKSEKHRNGDEQPPHYGGLGSAARK